MMKDRWINENLGLIKAASQRICQIGRSMSSRGANAPHNREGTTLTLFTFMLVESLLSSGALIIMIIIITTTKARAAFHPAHF